MTIWPSEWQMILTLQFWPLSRWPRWSLWMFWWRHREPREACLVYSEKTKLILRSFHKNFQISMNIFSSSKLLMTQFRIALTSGHIFQFGPSRCVVMMAANHLCFINQISINLKSCRAVMVGVLRLPEICTPWLVGRQWGLVGERLQLGLRRGVRGEGSHCRPAPARRGLDPVDYPLLFVSRKSRDRFGSFCLPGPSSSSLPRPRKG